MTRREAMRQASNYVLGLLVNFSESWECHLRMQPLHDAALLAVAMEDVEDVLRRWAKQTMRQRTAAQMKRREK